MKTSEEQFNENLSGLAELIEDKELFEFYKSVIISMLDSKPKVFCTCSFCMIRRDEKTGKKN